MSPRKQEIEQVRIAGASHHSLILCLFFGFGSSPATARLLLAMDVAERLVLYQAIEWWAAQEKESLKSESLNQ